MRTSAFHLSVLLIATLAIVASAFAQTPSEDRTVHGEPGNGRILVETRGGQKYWAHPGVYWLPKTTTLLEFIKLASPIDVPGGEMPNSGSIVVRHGDKARGRFQIRRVRADTVPGRFMLEDGDVLQNIPAL